MLIPECTKLVRVVPHPYAKNVIAVIDGVCITGSAITGIVASFVSRFEETGVEMPYPPGAVRLAY
jgi:hypothetical protein